MDKTDLISREAAIEAAMKVIERDTSGKNVVVEAMKAWMVYIMRLPSATVDPVKHGKWIKNEGRYGWHCSACATDDVYAFEWNSDKGEDELQDHYCPNCGARMDL